MDMVIDNFDLIKDYIEDYKHKLFYDCSIIRRGKDHPNLPSANHTIKTYFIESPECLQVRREEIIDLCNYFGARAYINLAPKSYEKLAKLTNFRLSERIYNGDYKKVYKCFNSCAGELKGENNAWIVDIDNLNCKQPIIAWLYNYFKNENSNKDPIHEHIKSIKLEVPTVSGCHLITDSFNLKAFHDTFPLVDIHKNNPTLLYYNNDISSKLN